MADLTVGPSLFFQIKDSMKRQIEASISREFHFHILNRHLIYRHRIRHCIDYVRAVFASFTIILLACRSTPVIVSEIEKKNCLCITEPDMPPQ